MSEFLESIKPESLVEQRTEVHNQLITTPTPTTLIVKTNFAIADKVLTRRTYTVERAEQKKNYHFYRAQQQIPPLKVLESVLFLSVIVFFSSITSLSAAKTNLPPSRFTEQEIQLLREVFLKKFGMKEQPKQAKPVLPVPYYVWNIYEKVKKEGIEWARHYYPYDIIEPDKSTLLLHYDLSVTVRNVTNEIVNRAELKLKLRSEKNRRHIKIYEVDQRNSEIWRLIDAKFIENDFRDDYQWVEMDVTEAIRRKRPNMNRVDFAVKLSNNHLTTYASTSYQPTAYSIPPYDRKQASSLVVYGQTDDTARVRNKRKANTRRRHQHKKHDHRSADKNYCHRIQLLVDFNELNWQDWILAPSSYSAYQCQGECPNPLTSHFNTTNHAIVQGLINSVDSSLVPAPCCVPTEMESLAILYIDVEGKIVIKNYPDMEVLSCGCR